MGQQCSDVLVGSYGDDNLSGLNGNDTLIGGDGADTLTGNRGADHFVYGSIFDALGDTVADFNHKEGDKFDFSQIDADIATDDNDAFTFNGTSAFSGVAGELRIIEEPR